MWPKKEEKRIFEFWSSSSLLQYFINSCMASDLTQNLDDLYGVGQKSYVRPMIGAAAKDCRAVVDYLYDSSFKTGC